MNSLIEMESNSDYHTKKKEKKIDIHTYWDV
jgi:hypothetical protein